jgi:hypothetical protein
MNNGGSFGSLPFFFFYFTSLFYRDIELSKLLFEADVIAFVLLASDKIVDWEF